MRGTPPPSGDDRTDGALVAAFLAGDGAAFDELVNRHERRVYAICYRYFGNAADAEDATQDTFVILLRRASTYAGAAAFSTWLYRVAMNACNDLARRRARRPRVAGAGVEGLADLPATDDPLGDRELGVDLSRALARLDATTRDAIVLHDVSGLPYEDVAARLGLPIGTVKSRIHRGHARLADALRASTPSRVEPSAPARPPTLGS
jgi:RNA polymerase sigma-70 factor (ECF subfamily)